MNDVTKLLGAIQMGDEQATEELLVLVYRELKVIAAAKMSKESPGNTLQPTALVHEAWLRLIGSGSPSFNNRAHFFGAAAEAMRRILVERARKSRAKKRSAEFQPDFNEALEVAIPPPSDEILKIHEALDDLASQDPEAANLVKLRYFVGMKMDEAADAMNVPLRTAERSWAYAKAWLRRRISSQK